VADEGSAPLTQQAAGDLLGGPELAQTLLHDLEQAWLPHLPPMQPQGLLTTLTGPPVGLHRPALPWLRQSALRWAQDPERSRVAISNPQICNPALAAGYWLLGTSLSDRATIITMPAMTPSRGRTILAIILAAAALLRVALLLAALPRGSGALFTPDSHDYDQLARSLLDRGEFSRFADGRPELFRTPGYPLFVAGVYALSGRSPWAVALVQIGLDVLVCYLVYRMGRRAWSQRAGLLAAGLQAVSPAAIVSSVRLLSEQLFTLMLMLAVTLLAGHFIRAPRGEQKGHGESPLDARKRAASILRPLAAGLLLGLGCMVRPAGLPLIALGSAVLLAGPRRWASAGVFLAGGLVAVLPWLARNAVEAGYPHISGVADYNLFYCNALGLAEREPQLPLTPRQQELASLAQEPNWPPMEKINDPRFLAEIGRQGRQIILAHPLAYARMHLRTTLNVFLPAATDVLEVAGLTSGNKGTLAVLRKDGLRAASEHYFAGNGWAIWLALPMALICAGRILLGLIGLAAGAFRPTRLWALLAVIVLYFVLSPGPVAHARFRVPIEPVFSLLAAGLFISHEQREQEKQDV
jgi:4-amino-4-deoxy-L-arabinose transferase-like glycosyltransferase